MKRSNHPASTLSPANLPVNALVLLAGAIIVSTLLATNVGCEPGDGSEQTLNRKAESGEPSYITVQHILIGFDGSLPGKKLGRNMVEAEALAEELLEKAKTETFFSKLVEQYSDDSPEGIYKMANFGFPTSKTSTDPSKNVMARDGMVAAFGDVGFKLEVGEVGLAPYDSKTSPYGWHIIKRLE